MRTLTGLSVAGVLIGACALTAQADLVHRYDFAVDSTTTVADTVGTANGKLLNGASTAGGVLTTNGNNGGTSGQWGGSGPMMTLDSSATAGITGAFTIEDWFSCTTGWPKFDTLYAFSDNTSNNYLLGAPVRADAGYPSGVGLVGGGGLTRAQIPTYDIVLHGIYLDTGLHQTVLSYDGNSFSYYIDGVLAETTDFDKANGYTSTYVDPGFNLSSLPDIGVNGGSPYPDPALTGSTYDFRIYSGGLSAGQVASMYALGSDASNSAIAGVAAAAPEPASLGLLGVGAVALMGRRRRV